jgi:hypothetical protein
VSAHDDCHRGKLFSNTPTFRTLYLKPSSCCNRKGANLLAPSLTLIALRFHQSSPHSFEATRDARCAARHNQVTVGVEDFKGNCISERVPVNTDLDGAGESVCLYPDPGRAKNEGVGDRAVIVALGVPPDTQTGRG